MRRGYSMTTRYTTNAEPVKLGSEVDSYFAYARAISVSKGSFLPTFLPFLHSQPGHPINFWITGSRTSRHITANR